MSETSRQDDSAFLDRVLDVAVTAARDAGRLIRTNCGKIGVEKTKSCAQDLATVTDTECQELVRAAFARHFPEFKLLGEEEVPPGSAASKAALTSVLAAAPW